ncbi:UDP-glucose 4-epimerase GalE [Polynucleobacter nymphae]|uniref:UDP-glucose 4-epimerase GalE n=1 Tax=Polynucleobacter nymphae TaxID=2081043 RepID=UPI001C0B6A76|nr:UDP-glucose 4-epimerase GalE [Polynucleobacter nymphae]
MNILLTGGTGYIGSHTAVVLSQAGHEVVLLDNFCNSSPSVLERLEKILGKALPCIEADVRETDVVEKVLREYKIDAVIHFAGLKAVSESVANPVLYYANNVQGSISLLQAMQEVDVKTLVFSSSATVYGEPQYLPYDEDHPTKPMNPYGQSKLQVEEILRDLAASDSKWRITSLRYFNPVGAHESGLIGEEPNGIPNNLMPYVVKVASGELPHLNIFGDDYETLDGTGERDYIHVMDLAEGHMAALHFQNVNAGSNVVNLGTGKSSGVLEIVKAFENITGKVIPLQFAPRRAGDLPIYFAQTGLAKEQLHWVAKRNLIEMCESSWKFQELQGHVKGESEN